MAENQTPAGWYPDPSGNTAKLRYWDGSAWTNDYQDTQAVVQSGAPTGYAPTASGTAYPGATQTPGTTGAYNPYAPTGQPVMAPVNDKSGMAVAALVLGIVGVSLGCCLGIYGFFISVPAGILGIIFGIISRNSSRKGMAITGLILGIACFAVPLLGMLLLTPFLF